MKHTRKKYYCRTYSVFSVDGENLYAPFNSTKISMNILKGKKFIAGKNSTGLLQRNNNKWKENAVGKTLIK